jgi:serine protease
MNNFITKMTLAVAAFVLCSFGVQAQELTPDAIARLMGIKVPPQARFVPGEVIVKMKPSLGMTAQDLTRMGVQKDKRVTSGGEIIYQIAPSVKATMSATAVRDRTQQIVREFRARPDVEYAQPNYILRIADKTPNDPLYARQWHYFNNGTGAGQYPGGINLPKAWDGTTGSSSVVVAVIDTGILPNHPDIQGSPNLIAGYDMITDPFTANDNNGRDIDPTDPGDAVTANECGYPHDKESSSWHGTHVAGTIGVGNTNNGIGVAGINWAVKVQAVRVLGKCGGTTSDINDAIRWAAGLPVPGVPNNATRARVINMSLGGGVPCSMSPSTQAAINDAVNAGTVVVVAAGNDGTDASQSYPASCDNVITVAAGDYRGSLAWYSNYGSKVKIMAPGGDVYQDLNGVSKGGGVLSMVDPSAGTYAFYMGTSMATPHVSGVAALLLAKEPTLTPAQLLARLQSYALPRDSTQCPQPCGAGLLSAVPRDGSPPLAINLTLDKTDLGIGETTTATATVTLSGAPLSGKAVAFGTGSGSVASVSPTSEVTKEGGKAQTTVKGEGKGETTISATANGTSATAPVKVPDLSLIGVVALMVGVGIVAKLRKRSISHRK